MHKSIIWIGLILMAGSSKSQTLAPVSDSRSTEFAQAISIEQLHKNLEVLTADSLEGRESGTRGGRKAARYIASIFRRNGLIAPVSGSYFLPVPLKKWTTHPARLTINGRKLVQDTDFISLARGGAPGTHFIQSEIVIGLHAAGDTAYNQVFNTLDLQGKVLWILEQKDPKGVIPKKIEASAYQLLRKELGFFIAKKPKALFLVGSLDESLRARAIQMNRPSQPQIGLDPTLAENQQVPVYSLSESVAQKIFSSPDHKNLQFLANHSPIILPLVTKLDVPLRLDEAEAAEVLGYLEGTDLKEELLVISAHYDHLGIHKGKIYHGADDDGSGTAALLSLADAFSRAKKEGAGPRRSILFLANVGEEKGLLGSRYYTDHPVFSIQKTITDLNMDMIGRIDTAHRIDSNYVYIIGAGKLSSSLQAQLEEVNRLKSHLALDYTYDSPTDPNQFYFRSDHYNFARLGVPIIFFFNGVHEDYHRATDGIEKINFGIYQKRAQLVFYTAWDLANRTQRPTVDRVNDFQTR